MNPLLLKLPADLFEERFNEVEFQKGITKPTDGRVIREGSGVRESGKPDEQNPIIEGFL